MNILFYTTPPAPGSPTMIFNEDWALFMVGQKVTHNGHTYQVNALEWKDDTRKELKAYCEELPISHQNI